MLLTLIYTLINLKYRKNRRADMSTSRIACIGDVTGTLIHISFKLFELHHEANALEIMITKYNFWKAMAKAK